LCFWQVSVLNGQQNYHTYSFSNTNSEYSVAKDLIQLESGDLLLYMMSLDPYKQAALIRLDESGEEVFRTEFPLFKDQYDLENSIFIKENRASIYHSWDYSNALPENVMYRTSIDIETGAIIGDTLNVVFDYDQFSDFDQNFEFRKTWTDADYFYVYLSSFRTPGHSCQALLKFDEHELLAYTCFDGQSGLSSLSTRNYRNTKAANVEFKELFSVEYIVNDSSELTGQYNAQLFDFEGNLLVDEPLQEGYLGVVGDAFYFEDGLITTRAGYYHEGEQYNKVGMAILNHELQPQSILELYEPGRFYKPSFAYLPKSERILLFHTEMIDPVFTIEKANYISIFDLSLNHLGTKELDGIFEVFVQDVLEEEDGNFQVFGAQHIPTTAVNEIIGWQYAGHAFMFQENVFDIESAVGINNNIVETLTLIPNPSQGSFQIGGLDEIVINVNSSLRVYDQMGKIVFESKELEAGKEFEVDFLPSGIYFVRIGENRSAKLILH